MCLYLANSILNRPIGLRRTYWRCFYESGATAGFNHKVNSTLDCRLIIRLDDYAGVAVAHLINKIRKNICTPTNFLSPFRWDYAGTQVSALVLFDDRNRYPVLRIVCTGGKSKIYTKHGATSSIIVALPVVRRLHGP